MVFPAQSVHGIDVSEHARMYCLELMQPNDMFAGEALPAHTSLTHVLDILLAWLFTDHMSQCHVTKEEQLSSSTIAS